MDAVKLLNNQLAHLTQRVNQVKALPMLARPAHIDELISLQLGLLGDLVDRVNLLTEWAHHESEDFSKYEGNHR